MNSILANKGLHCFEKSVQNKFYLLLHRSTHRPITLGIADSGSCVDLSYLMNTLAIVEMYK